MRTRRSGPVTARAAVECVGRLAYAMRGELIDLTAMRLRLPPRGRRWIVGLRVTAGLLVTLAAWSLLSPGRGGDFDHPPRTFACGSALFPNGNKTIQCEVGRNLAWAYAIGLLILAVAAVWGAAV